jgi:ankyrin repeat protein
VAAGDKVNMIDRWGWTPLIWAVYYNSAEVTDYLLEQGADPNARTVKGYGAFGVGTTALMLGGYYGYTDLVEHLLAHGAKTDLADRKGVKALDYAKQYRFREVIALLEHPPVAVAKSSDGQNIHN